MAGQQALTKIERIVAARYGPLVLPVPLNAMPVGDYQEFMPKFTRTKGVSAEEHLESFYSYIDNLDINEEDVWMRVFVQSLDGEARKWFRSLPPRSIADIKALDDVFLKHWGNNKDLLFYYTEFVNLQREDGELLSDFNIRFNHMYSRMPAKIRPTPASAMLTYAHAFDSQFCLLLRERICASLANMQDVAFEVESNILVAERLEGDAERRRQRGESSSPYDFEIDKPARMIELLASEVSRLQAEKYSEEAGVPCDFCLPKPNPYRGAQKQLQILQRNQDANKYQRVKTLCQNIVMEEEQLDEEEEVHGLEDKGSAPFLTRAAYEKAISKGTAHEFVVAAEQQADQQKQSAAGPTILQEFFPKASSYSHGYANLQIS